MDEIKNIVDFAKFRGEYQRRATKRLDERKSTGLLDGDNNIWVMEEMLVDLFNRLNKVETFLDLKPKE